MDFKFYISLFMRRLHWFLLLLVIGSALGLTLAKVLPPVYIAEARLLVESEQIPGDLAASTVRTQPAEQLEIIQQRILTRNTLVDLANRFDVYETQSGTRRPMDTDSLVSDMRRRIRISTSGGQARATLVSVRFEAPTAALAASMTNELVTMILREDVRIRTGVARQTLEFFEQEVDRLDKELAERGGVILDFKEKNLSALPDSLDFRRSQQAAAQERLLQLEREAAGLRDQRNRLVSLNERMGAQLAVPQQQQTPEQQQLQNLEDDLSQQLAVLSPTNPRIKLLQARIASLREIVDRQPKAPGTASREGQLLSAFEAQLAEIDGRLDFIAGQQSQVTGALAGLEASIEQTASNANTLDTLERDYANVRVQYDEAVANKARAETGDVIEALSKGQRISIIEQAVLPNEPVRPNRVAIAAGGIGGGMVLGFAMVFLLEFLNKGIRRPVDLTAKLGITPFATLPYYRTRRETLRRRTLIAAILGVVVIVIPLGLWAVDIYYAPLEQILEQVIQRFGSVPQSAPPLA
jgi:uncharacterized protein involved in exopolysaccharide biosynthesis